MSCQPSERIMQTIRVSVPGVTDDLLRLQMFNVMDEFLRRTNAWQHLEDIELIEGETNYDIPTPAGSEVVRWLGVSHKQTPITASPAQSGVTMSSLGTLVPDLTFPDGDASYLPAATDLHPGTGVFTYTVYRPNYISISGAPSAEDVKFPLVVALALTVGKSCLECEDCGDWDVPEYMWDMFFQDWNDGTLGRLYAMPAKPWSSPTHAQYHLKRFRNQMAFRMQEARRGYVWNMPAWRFPRGW